MDKINRRAAFLGMGALSVGVVAPVAAAASGHLVSDRDFATLRFLENAPANARANYHATELGQILRGYWGGGWVVSEIIGIPAPGMNTAPSIVMFVQHPGKSGVYVPTFNLG